MASPAMSTASLRTSIYTSIDPANFQGALTGKVALVTGSGRGIGKEIAKALARCGATVCVTGRTQSEVEQATKEVQEVAVSNVKVIGVPADGLKREDLEMLVKKVNTELGIIDILVCNAGTNTFMPFHLTEPDDWWYSMEINVRSPVELTRIVLPQMRERNAGTIIYTSSRAAIMDLAWTTAYGAGKTAITRFAGCLQIELDQLQTVHENHFEHNGISVFSIHPGEIETKLHQTGFPEKTRKEAPYVIEHMEKIGAKRPHFEADLPAMTCVFLASGKGDKLRGKYVDCTRDVGEVIEMSG